MSESITPENARQTFQAFKLVNKDGMFVELAMRREELIVEFNFGQAGAGQKTQIKMDAVESITFLKAAVNMLIDQIVTTRNRLSEKDGMAMQQQMQELLKQQIKNLKDMGGGDEPWRQSL